MIDKDKLRRVFKIVKIVVAAIVIIAAVTATAVAMKFTYDFFIGGLFGGGKSSGFEQYFPGAESPVPTETQPTEPTEITEVSQATITAGGDVMMHIPVINSGKQNNGTYNYDSIFSKISDYVNRSDYAMVNLETTLGGTENGREYSGFPQFNCPDEIVDAVKNAGFDMFLTANNHANDTGAAGLKRTYSTIQSKGMEILGTMESEEEPKYQILEVNGIKIGMICYTYGEIDSNTGRPSVNGLPLDDSVSSRINVFDYYKLDVFYGQIQNHIEAMKKDGAEALVLFIHWGEEYWLSPNDYQKQIAQKMCDLGIDVIVGGHPHVVEPITLLTSTADSSHKTVCMYSVGNIISNQRSDNVGVSSGHTEDGVLFSFTFVKYSNGEVHLDSAELLPTWVQMWKENSQKQYCILPLDKDVDDWQTALGIGESDYASAQKSYERTMTIVGDGLETVQTHLSQAKEEREAAFAGEEPAVG